MGVSIIFLLFIGLLAVVCLAMFIVGLSTKNKAMWVPPLAIVGLVVLMALGGMFGMAFVGLILLLLALVCVALLVTGLVKKKPGMWVPPLALGGVLAVVLVGLFFVRVQEVDSFERDSRYQELMATHSRQQEHESELLLSERASWVASAVLVKQQNMQVNHCPDEASAWATLLAVFAQDEAGADWIDGEGPLVLRRETNTRDRVFDDQHTSEWLEALRGMGVDDGRVTLVGSENALDAALADDERLVELEVMRRSDRWQMVRRIRHLPKTWTVPFENAQWVEQGQGPVEIDGQSGWVGHSSLTETPEQAREQALKHLAAVMQSRQPDDGNHRWVEAIGDGVVAHEVNPGGHHEWRRTHPIRASFLQSVTNERGTFWREAVVAFEHPDSVHGGPFDQSQVLFGRGGGRSLGGASEPARNGVESNMSSGEAIVHRATEGMVSRGKLVKVIASTLGFVALFFALDWVTKGYHRGRLVLGLGGLLLLLMLALA